MSNTQKKPLLSFWQIWNTNVFITREEHYFISDPAALEGESIVFPEGTAMEGLIRERYPNLEIKVVPSEDDALKMVSSRRSSMTMRSLIVAAYIAQTRSVQHENCRAVAHVYEPPAHWGKQGGCDPAQYSGQGVQSITPQERGRVVNQHISIKMQTAINPLWVSLGRGAYCDCCKPLGLLDIPVAEAQRHIAAYFQYLDKLTGLANRQKLSSDMAEPCCTRSA